MLPQGLYETLMMNTDSPTYTLPYTTSTQGLYEALMMNTGSPTFMLPYTTFTQGLYEAWMMNTDSPTYMYLCYHTPLPHRACMKLG